MCVDVAFACKAQPATVEISAISCRTPCPVSCLWVASWLARTSFGNTLKANLLDPASVSSFDRHDIAVDAQPLTGARQMPDSTDDVTANGSYILIFPL